MEEDYTSEFYDCEIKLRKNPQRRKDKVYVGCGAGFGGDRPLAALKLLQRVEQLNYLVLECLAERTLADRYQSMMSGGEGYDPRISEWMLVLLPLAVKRGVCIITNMGAVDPLGAQNVVLDVASKMRLEIVVSVSYETSPEKKGLETPRGGYSQTRGGTSTYMGAAPIVYCLEKYKPNVVITSRVADAALFLAPMVYELGWNWNDYRQLAQGTLAGHLLECGCQLTGGYFMHPGDKYRSFSFGQLLNLSLPYAEIGYDGEVCVAKVNGSGGLLNSSTCAEQLLYEVADPVSYITPDVVLNLQHVNFRPLSKDRVMCQGVKPSIVMFPDKLLQLVPMDYGWKGWGEISYGGEDCLKRAEAADFLVRSWFQEVYPGVKDCITSYVIGHNSLKASLGSNQPMDVRLRMDGLFKLKEHAACFVREFTALYTNGPAGGGGVLTGQKKEIILHKELVDRKHVFWQTRMRQVNLANSGDEITLHDELSLAQEVSEQHKVSVIIPMEPPAAAPSGKKIPLYQVAHSRAGDKGNDLNFSIIPHFPADIEKLKKVVTPNWVVDVVSPLLDNFLSPDHQAIKLKENQLIDVRVNIYEVPGIHSLNVVVQNILDGGVNCSRRIDRHGKTISDIILSQDIVLPP